MEEIILTCEDCAEGILTSVYRAYEWKLPRDRVRIQAGEADLCLFASYRNVKTEAALAKKVADTVKRRMGEELLEEIGYAMAARDRRKGTAVLRVIEAGLEGRIRRSLAEGLGDGWIRIAFELSRRVRNEVHRGMQFLRFREAEDGYLFALTEPKEDVTAFLMPHFSDRLPRENFIIVDTLRKTAGVHPAGKPWFLVRLEEGERERISGMTGRTTQEEKEIAELFCRFFHTISIRERKNLRLQQQFLPLRFRGTMTEFDGQG